MVILVIIITVVFYVFRKASLAVQERTVGRLTHDQFAVDYFFPDLCMLVVEDLFKEQFGHRFPDFFRELVDGTDRRRHIPGAFTV